ncbi:hypothetical protein MGG_15781 [Pyricularia oryzae 70-15]|uniref:Uncharacterized protein n=1 Tax=Pyricularia oryzae (strain 70-15 / ATCC MYA-4617 / FGSC 8958) TaxID=242507 RepID=G4MW85_PYRO7|nr:uncharacterized protein MGG_15781 [Pyricularia oryzae 70-15]EHA55045.1 hypothetical protein MGG_15781 [Pyricularia oryzae 70-15]
MFNPHHPYSIVIGGRRMGQGIIALVLPGLAVRSILRIQKPYYVVGTAHYFRL